MAEVENEKTLTLAQQYSLQEKEEQPDQGRTTAESTNTDNPANTIPEEVVEEKTEETLAAADEKTEETHVAADEKTEETPVAADENSEAPEQEAAGDEEAVEGAPEIKLETAPADFRFPTTNQSRHCFTRYVEYHRCIAAKGEGASECDKFAKYYRSLCPGEWVDRWNEQRENGTFPGPL